MRAVHKFMLARRVAYLQQQRDITVAAQEREAERIKAIDKKLVTASADLSLLKLKK